MPKHKKYAIVYTWPGSSQNAESEVIRRMLVAADNINVKFDVVSKEGFILDDNFAKTDKKIQDGDYEFMMTLHYDDVKLWDSFHYHTLWNPPLISLQYANYPEIVKNIISNDDFLIYDDGGMSGHLRAMTIDTPRDLEGASSLTASFPGTALKKPVLNDPVLFYCGINWEKMIGTQPRHEGLFQLLDKLEDVNIYGPASTWDGYKTYKGTIPFDGFSLVEEAHRCGVVLALSSDFHYRAGAATNRVYEGCAAGAVIISDTNSFIKEHFGDSILYIDFDKDHPERMFAQIKKHMDWIKNNKSQALKLAEKAQKIFLEKFTLERQLSDIINNHENRKNAVERSLYARDKESKTLATFFLDNIVFDQSEKDLLSNTIKNIAKQIDKNITLAICCDNRTHSSVKQYIQSLHTDVDIVLKSYPIYDEFKYKWVSRGQILFDMINTIPHDYLCILDGYEAMFSDHITTLKRALEDHPNKIAAYCGTFLDSKDANRYRLLNGCIAPQDVFDCFYPNRIQNVSGMFLMRNKIEKFLTDYICAYLDGLEVSALLNIAYFKMKEEFIYSERTTCGCYEILIKSNPMIMDRVKQINFIRGLFVYDYEQYRGEHVLNNNAFLNGGLLSQIEWLRKKEMHRIYLRIAIIKLRNLFVFSRAHREKNRKRIKEYKVKIQKIRTGNTGVI